MTQRLYASDITPAERAAADASLARLVARRALLVATKPTATGRVVNSVTTVITTRTQRRSRS
jgi:hypothetical protein